jgi:hypothetical protein
MEEEKMKEGEEVKVTDDVEKKLEDKLKSVKWILSEYGIDRDFAFSVIESPPGEIKSKSNME